jgi:hypothetical protein
VAQGPEEPPADLRATNGKQALPLVARDREVRLALETLKSHGLAPATTVASQTAKAEASAQAQ